MRYAVMPNRALLACGFNTSLGYNLLRFHWKEKSSTNQNNLAFVWHKCCRLMCVRLTKPNSSSTTIYLVLVVQVEVCPAPGQRHSVSEDRDSGFARLTQPDQV